MKRRDFLTSVGAATVVPVLPLPAFAASVQATPLNTMQVGWAALFARVNDRASPALIQKWLGVGPDQAQALMSELSKRNIIHAPVAGSAASVQPMYPQGGIPGVTKSPLQIIHKARDAFNPLIEQDEPSVEAVTPATEVDQENRIEATEFPKTPRPES